MNPKCLRDLLIDDEGLRLKPYIDQVGKVTIGVGRNLTNVGISFDEAMLMLDNSIVGATRAAQTFSWFSNLNPVRQDVIVNMIYNLGLTDFLEFKDMIAALYAGQNNAAADAMLDSRWAKQVGERADRLATMMRTGLYP